MDCTGCSRAGYLPGSDCYGLENFAEAVRKIDARLPEPMLSQEMEEVKTIYKTMRGWRHDYHNHMQSVKAYLAEENTAGAQAYLDRLETDLDQVRLLFDTGNLNVDAILNAKISLALEREIPCHYNSDDSGNSFSVSDIDLCVILGNLIDNAVEACRDVEPKVSFCAFYIAPMKQQFYISGQ